MLAALVLCSCFQSEKSDRYSLHTSKTKHAFLDKHKDTLFITHKAAVWITLDSAQSEKLRKRYGNSAEDAYAEDGMYYDYLADSVLKQKKTPIVQAVNYKYIGFVQPGGKTSLIRVDTLSQISTLYFFIPGKPPYLADVIDIEAEYKRFFH